MVDESWQITGIVVSFLGLFTSIVIAFYLRYLEGKRRERDETFYVTATTKDIQQLKEHLINIQNISESEETNPTKNEQIEITQKLVDYSNKNKKLIELLILDTRFSMSKWMNLSSSEKKDVESFIDTTNWVLINYLPNIDESNKTQIRRWSNYLKEFQKRKNMSSQKIDNLLLKYA